MAARPAFSRGRVEAGGRSCRSLLRARGSGNDFETGVIPRGRRGSTTSTVRCQRRRPGRWAPTRAGLIGWHAANAVRVSRGRCEPSVPTVRRNLIGTPTWGATTKSAHDRIRARFIGVGPTSLAMDTNEVTQQHAAAVSTSLGPTRSSIPTAPTPAGLPGQGGARPVQRGWGQRRLERDEHRCL